MARLFFALWPPDRVAGVLGDLAVAVAARCGGRAMPARKIHLTLAFLGEVPDERMEAVLDAARAVPPAAFDLRIDRLGGFRRSKVAWAGARPGPALAQLQSALTCQLRARGFALEERPFAPHVTLARKVERALPPTAMEPLLWRVRGYRLVRTEPGTGEYLALAEFRRG